MEQDYKAMGKENYNYDRALVPLLVVGTTRTLSPLLHEKESKPSLFKGVVEYLHLVDNHFLANVSFWTVRYYMKVRRNFYHFESPSVEPSFVGALFNGGLPLIKGGLEHDLVFLTLLLKGTPSIVDKVPLIGKFALWGSPRHWPFDGPFPFKSWPIDHHLNTIPTVLLQLSLIHI